LVTVRPCDARATPIHSVTAVGGMGKGKALRKLTDTQRGHRQSPKRVRSWKPDGEGLANNGGSLP